MIEAIIVALIYICVAAIILYIIFYVFASVIEKPIPPKIVQIIWLIFLLLAALWLLRAILPGLGVALP